MLLEVTVLATKVRVTREKIFSQDFELPVFLLRVEPNTPVESIYEIVNQIVDPLEEYKEIIIEWEVLEAE